MARSAVEGRERSLNVRRKRGVRQVYLASKNPFGCVGRVGVASPGLLEQGQRANERTMSTKVI